MSVWPILAMEIWYQNVNTYNYFLFSFFLFVLEEYVVARNNYSDGSENIYSSSYSLCCHRGFFMTFP